MSFPKYNEHGFLPIGTHVVSLGEIQQAVATNDQRRSEIWESFKSFARRAQDSGLFVNLFFFGSFFSVKPVPSDIDVALQFSEAVAPSEEHLFLFNQAQVKHDYRTDVIFVEPKSAEFRKLLPTGLKFVGAKLVMCRVLSREQEKEVAQKLKVFPQELSGREFKGVLHVPMDHKMASFLRGPVAACCEPET
jgi:hypothetical protein